MKSIIILLCLVVASIATEENSNGLESLVKRFSDQELEKIKAYTMNDNWEKKMDDRDNSFGDDKNRLFHASDDAVYYKSMSKFNQDLERSSGIKNDDFGEVYNPELSNHKISDFGTGQLEGEIDEADENSFNDDEIEDYSLTDTNDGIYEEENANNDYEIYGKFSRNVFKKDFKKSDSLSASRRRG